MKIELSKAVYNPTELTGPYFQPHSASEDPPGDIAQAVHSCCMQQPGPAKMHALGGGVVLNNNNGWLAAPKFIQWPRSSAFHRRAPAVPYPGLAALRLR